MARTEDGRRGHIIAATQNALGHILAATQVALRY